MGNNYQIAKWGKKPRFFNFLIKEKNFVKLAIHKFISITVKYYNLKIK